MEEVICDRGVGEFWSLDGACERVIFGRCLSRVTEI